MLNSQYADKFNNRQTTIWCIETRELSAYLFKFNEIALDAAGSHSPQHKDDSNLLITRVIRVILNWSIQIVEILK